MGGSGFERNHDSLPLSDQMRRRRPGHGMSGPPWTVPSAMRTMRSVVGTRRPDAIGTEALAGLQLPAVVLVEGSGTRAPADLPFAKFQDQPDPAGETAAVTAHAPHEIVDLGMPAVAFQPVENIEPGRMATPAGRRN
jgi:hypothetical protein